MSDQRRWFKVWTTILHDPTFLSLPLESLGRWVLLGAWVAAHGNRGTVAAKETALRHTLRIPADVTVQCALSVLPNVQFGEAESSNGTSTVTLANWLKYQEDTTMAERQRRHRYKRRGEEKRDSSVSSLKSGSGSVLKEETKGSTSIGSQAKVLLDFWSDKYLEKHGQRPEVEGKRDMECAKALVRGRSLDQAKAIVLFHFENASDFYRERNLYGLHHIRKDCNQIISRMQGGPSLRLPEKTKRNLEAAAQFLQTKKDKPW